MFYVSLSFLAGWLLITLPLQALRYEKTALLSAFKLCDKIRFDAAHIEGSFVLTQLEKQ